MDTKPQYQHDCKRCHFLGPYSDQESATEYDLYVCQNLAHPTLTTLLARYGDEGSNYASSPVDVLAKSNASSYYGPMVAWNRAFEKGLVLGRQQLKELEENPHLSNVHIEAAKYIDAMHTFMGAEFAYNKATLNAALNYIKSHVRGDEPHEKEFIEATKKYLQKVIDG